MAHVRWWAVNRLLAAGLELMTGKGWVAGNLSVKAKDVTGLVAKEALANFAASTGPRGEAAR